ncbi:MAG: hypothetical protein QXY48_05100 [Sulfolobales archaeon]
MLKPELESTQVSGRSQVLKAYRLPVEPAVLCLKAVLVFHEGLEGMM